MRLPTVFLLLFITVVLLELSEAARGGGRGGGGRGGSRGGSRGSRGRSSSRSRSSSKPSITKYTPIKATTVRSPVIVKQTKLGSRSSTLKKAVVGYLVYRYALSNAPVYRSGYPMYRRYVSIPEKRAVRVTYEEETLLDANGNLCLGQSSSQRSLREGIDKNLVELKTTVKNKDTGQMQTYYDNTDISLDDMNGQDFEVLSRARYNTTIVEGTTCTQVEKKVEGTMVTLYETNPNEANLFYVNHKLFVTVISLFSFIHVLQSLY